MWFEKNMARTGWIKYYLVNWFEKTISRVLDVEKRYLEICFLQKQYLVYWLDKNIIAGFVREKQYILVKQRRFLGIIFSKTISRVLDVEKCYLAICFLQKQYLGYWLDKKDISGFVWEKQYGHYR